LAGRFRLPFPKSALIKHWWAVDNLCGTSWERSHRADGRLTIRPPDWPISIKVKYQESLANAKVRKTVVHVRRPLAKKYTKNQRKEHNVEKYGLQMDYNSVAVFIRLAVVASQICKIPRNSSKIRTYPGSSKVIDLGVNRKRICNFLLVRLVTLDVSHTVFEILTFKTENGLFSNPSHIRCPRLGETVRISE